MATGAVPQRARIDYPESDGAPMADNTLQFRWIVTVKGNLDAGLPDFVAGDLLWYPFEGDNVTRVAPDVLVALGRPKGERGSYRQWEEGGVAPQVVFEVLSPGNTVREMREKRELYDRLGVEEYYVLDPEVEVVEAYHRRGEHLSWVPHDGDLVSPRLGVRFVRRDGRLVLSWPDGQAFRTFEELKAHADAESARADAASARADAASARAEAEASRADAEAARAARLAERLRALGVDPEREDP